KGIVHPEDAKKALVYNVDGIIVSNNGSRQVNGGIAALDALPEVCDVIQCKIPVLMDSGNRRGSDEINAMSLVTIAVIDGRLLMYGLAVSGQQGVKKVLNNLIADLDITLGLAGEKSVREIKDNVRLKR